MTGDFVERVGQRVVRLPPFDGLGDGCLDAHRAKMNRGEEVLLDEVIVVDESPCVESVVLGRERMARLGERLGRLNERTRDLFLAHRVDGLTYREIGEQHGLSTSAVEKHVARATLQLTTWMEGW